MNDVENSPVNDALYARFGERVDSIRLSANEWITTTTAGVYHSGDVTKLGLRKAPAGPITQIRTSSRIPLVDVGTVQLVRKGLIEILGGGVRSMDVTGVTFEAGLPST